MSSLPYWAYPGLLVASLLLSSLLVPVAMSAVAVHFGFLDHPGPTKSHTEAVPYLGGAAIVVAFAAIVLVGVAVDPPPSGSLQLTAFLGLGALLALVGLIDDLTGGVSPWLRLGLEIAAAVAVSALGSSAHLTGVPQPLDAIVSVVWIVGVTNAFNLLDNMDGLSAGTATIAALTIFGVAAIQHRYLVVALAIALAGCAAGFLRSNFHPAKIFMGDAGSLFLGFVLSVLLLKLRADAGPRRCDPGHPRAGPIRHLSSGRNSPRPPDQPLSGRPGPYQPPLGPSRPDRTSRRRCPVRGRRVPRWRSDRHVAARRHSPYRRRGGNSYGGLPRRRAARPCTGTRGATTA